MVMGVIIIIFAYHPQFPTPGVGRDISYFHCFLSSAIPSMRFNFLLSSSTTLFKVFFSLPTGLLSPAPLLSYVCYSHPYVLHDQTISTSLP